MIITEQAQEKLKTLLNEEPDASYFRVGVTGGGCAGFQYGFSLDDKKNLDDNAVECDGFEVLVDAMSWEFLKNSEIGYEQDLTGSSFTISNPDASSTCGCGTSFCPAGI